MTGIAENRYSVKAKPSSMRDYSEVLYKERFVMDLCNRGWLTEQIGRRRCQANAFLIMKILFLSLSQLFRLESHVHTHKTDFNR